MLSAVGGPKQILRTGVVTEMTISHLAWLHILDICPLVDIFIALAKFAVIFGANRGLVIHAFVLRSDNIKHIMVNIYGILLMLV